MKFKIIENGDSIRQHDMPIIEKIVDRLQENEDSFLILEPKEPINNSVYIQAAKQGDTYFAETRLIFGSLENFRHYYLKNLTKDQILDILESYYIKNSLENINIWQDITSDFKEDADEDNALVKLYKVEDENDILYFEAWINEDDSVTVHKGKLGDIGSVETIENSKKKNSINPLIWMKEQIEIHKERNYKEINTPIELLIQYQITPKSRAEHSETIEAILNNCLGWTGNGHCECSSIEDLIVTFYCYVIDESIATYTIIDALEEESLLFENIKIAFADEIEGEYKLLYPNTGFFSLI